MQESFKKQLFTKFILVNDNNECLDNNFEALFSFANLLGIKIVKGEELANLSVFKFAAGMLGERVPLPFYTGFPESVRELTKEQLLFDQLVHYAITYGFGDFSGTTQHSVFKENFEKIAFKEKTKIKEFVILTEEEAKVELRNMVDNYLLSSRPLNEINFHFVKDYILEYNYQIKECNSKDTYIRLLIETEKLEFANSLYPNDFISIVEKINYERYANVNIKKLNLKNKDRKFLSNVLDILLENKFSIKDCYEKQQIWCGILHHIHYKPKTEKAVDFVNKMRSGINQSTFSDFEKELKNGNIKNAVDVLIKFKGPALVIRNLNYLVSRCRTQSEIEYVLNATKTENNIVLIQNLIQYSNYKNASARTFKFTKFNMMKMHKETEAEMVKRKSVISKQSCETICKFLEENLKANLKGKLGKVYIEDGMENIALPIQENTSMGGFNTLSKGSKIGIEGTKKVRAFVYWEKVHDIDLSAIGLDENYNQTEFSWRSMALNQSSAITFSGDITNGYNGASEYFDVDLDEFAKLKPDIKYLIFNANVYSAIPFKDCICTSGFMQRDIVHSGEIFEPKTVETSFQINCDSTFAHLFAIDIKERQVIWLNVARNSNRIVAGQTSFDGLIDYLNVTDTINLKKYFTMLASEIVTTKEEADVIISNENFENNNNAEIIRSYDTDKILKLLNE